MAGLVDPSPVVGKKDLACRHASTRIRLQALNERLKPTGFCLGVIIEGGDVTAPCTLNTRVAPSSKADVGSKRHYTKAFRRQGLQVIQRPVNRAVVDHNNFEIACSPVPTANPDSSRARTCGSN